jgi:hypothetical protein
MIGGLKMPKRKFKNRTRIAFFAEQDVKQDVEVTLGKAGVTMTDYLNLCLGLLRSGKLTVRRGDSPRVYEVGEKGRINPPAGISLIAE